MRHFLGSVVVQVRPLSQRYSWTSHATTEEAARQARRVRNRNIAINHDPMRGARFCYRVNVYARPRTGIVVAYSFDPHESLGHVLRVRLRETGFYEVPVDMFRRLAIMLRDKQDRRSSTDFNFKDGQRVGRWLLDRRVTVDGVKYVMEVNES